MDNWAINLVVFVDEVDDDFDHGVFFFGAAFGDHQGEGNEGIVGDALCAVLIIKDSVNGFCVTPWRVVVSILEIVTRVPFTNSYSMTSHVPDFRGPTRRSLPSVLSFSIMRNMDALVLLKIFDSCLTLIRLFF